jgi:hypothetical protein
LILVAKTGTPAGVPLFFTVIFDNIPLGDHQSQPDRPLYPEQRQYEHDEERYYYYGQQDENYEHTGL